MTDITSNNRQRGAFPIPYSALDHRLKTGGTVILDGGTGTELQRRIRTPGAYFIPGTPTV